MSVLKSSICWFKTRIFTYLISRPLVNRLLDRLNETRSHDIASRAGRVLGVAAAPERIIDLMEHEYGDKILELMCDSRLADVIALVEKKAGGSFKYVGGGEIKVIVGSGPQRMTGWLATDIDQLNIVERSSWNRLFNPGSIDRILAEHVLEHLTLRELYSALGHAHTYLKPGGQFRFAVPDAFHPSRYYYNLVKPGGWETPYEHMLFLDHEILSRIAQDVGFEIQLLEYFDEYGVFHSVDYSSEDGAIIRCAKNNIGLDINDPEILNRFYESIPEYLRGQFFERQMTYTSLIADLKKAG